MVVIAVVGGTGSVGRTIVDALKVDGKHDAIVLARKVSDQVELSCSTICFIDDRRSQRETVLF
jgi:NAD dependent epimerase/dehydratase family enzyme